MAVHAAVWALALLTMPGLVPPRQLIAEGFSTLAVVLMSVNLMLSTRAGFLERRLDGLDKLFVTHRLSGLSVAVLVSSHFTLVPQSVGYVPSKPVAYTMLPLLLIAIFVASAPRFPWRRLVPLKYQTWKGLHRFQGLFVVAAVAHSLLAPAYTRRVPALAAYVYGVAALGLAAWVYRETLFASVGPFHTYSVRRAQSLTGDVLEVALAPRSAPLSRIAGQFVFVSFAEGPSSEQHPFTVSNTPASDLRLSIKASGDFTDALARDLADDSIARIEGPYGAFDFRKGRRRQLWLAGGIGITPFLSMAPALDAAREVTLVWSVRTRDEAVYADELRALGEGPARLTVIVHPTSELGHLDIATLDMTERAHDFSAFICGPLPMRREFMRQLRALGVPRSQVFFEEFRLR